MGAALLAESLVRRASFSDCLAYRYSLERRWVARARREHSLTFIGLNPSTGDAGHDDPTVRRCMGFARCWGFERVFVVNLFAWRTPLPAQLKCAADPVGEVNDEAIHSALRRSRLVVACWGRHGLWQARDLQLLGAVGRRMSCLGINADGSPVHPLYQPAAQPLCRYRSARTRLARSSGACG